MADVTITAANVVPVAGYMGDEYTAGETITAGQVVYQLSTDSEIYKADCDDTLAKATVKGIALNGASDGQPIKVLQGGNLNPGGTLTVGEIYVLSGTAGGIAPEGDLASSDYVSVLGVATTASNLKVNILNSGVQIP